MICVARDGPEEWYAITGPENRSGGFLHALGRVGFVTLDALIQNQSARLLLGLVRSGLTARL